MWTTLSMVSAIISLLSGVTGLIAFALELRRDGKLGRMSRMQSVALTVTLILTAAIAGIVAYGERKNNPPLPETHAHDDDTRATDTIATGSTANDATANDTTSATDTVVTHTVASDTSTTTRREPSPPSPPRGSIRIVASGGVPQGDVLRALNGSISAARRERSAITGRLDRNCRPDHAFPSVTACDDTLDLTIRDLRSGQEDGATLIGEGGGSTPGAAAQDARNKLIARIREHFSGEDRP